MALFSSGVGLLASSDMCQTNRNKLYEMHEIVSIAEHTKAMLKLLLGKCERRVEIDRSCLSNKYYFGGK